MIPLISKDATRRRVHKRIREKMLGTSERPRLIPAPALRILWTLLSLVALLFLLGLLLWSLLLLL